MPVVKSFTRAQWDAAARRLDALPEKPEHEHRVNVRDAMKSLQPQIVGAQRKGYTQEEIVQQIAQDGVKISAATLRYAMKHAAKEDRFAQTEKHVTTNADAALPRVKRAGPTRSSHTGSARTESQKKGDGGITRPESTPVKGFLGFPIRPDTENL
ncbi:hypothetical protein [Paraburkholderia youngii]|uniref:Uncharacterized protein n=1 Tax=Paraburkholderia youngii TaxID=2782701 RepID=A0ABX2NYI3_9BURK|nr:hypothetical protein [Paraburkholderia youngii]NUX59287.1 hypothetical protein [Paraburkholderia youngii]NVI09301.1 hypothetical protein [Paraburkholderia youngii]